MNGTYVSGGARLSFYESGAGLPVVFLHPTPLDHAYWLPLCERLQGVRAIIPDLRGHGGSELGTTLPVGGFARVPGAPVLTMAQLGADVLALLDHLSINEAVFAGCSIGGNVVLELWRQAPQRMKGLAFVCAKPQPENEAAAAKRIENIAKARANQVETLFDGMCQSLLSEATRKNHPQLAARVRANMKLTPEALVAVQAGLATRPDSVPTVATIRVPVLAIAGREDSSCAITDVEAFRAAPGGCEFHILPDAGHFAAYEQPDKVAELLAPWLQRFQA